VTLDQVPIPIATCADPADWKDLALCDIFLHVDGERTVGEIIEILSGDAPEMVTPTTSPKRNEPWDELSWAAEEGMYRGEPVTATYNGATQLVIEGLQHLHAHNYIRIIDRVTMGSVYTTTPKFKEVLVNLHHPGRHFLGSLLAGMGSTSHGEGEPTGDNPVDTPEGTESVQPQINANARSCSENSAMSEVSSHAIPEDRDVGAGVPVCNAGKRDQRLDLNSAITIALYIITKHVYCPVRSVYEQVLARWGGEWSEHKMLRIVEVAVLNEWLVLVQ
jgi:hypothetical protein